MELCSGDSPLRTKMCKTTDEPVGIPIPLPSAVPPIESWYVVARKIKTGTCSIYSSWKNYQEENEISSPPSSPSSKKKRRSIDDPKTTELAAFPTVAQAIAYVRNIGPESPRRPSSPVTASITSSPTTTCTPGNTIGRIIQTNLSPDDSQSSIPHDSTDGIANGTIGDSRSSPISRSRKRTHKRDTKTIEVMDEDCRTDSNDEDDRVAPRATSRSSPSPVASENPLKKRKVEVGSDRLTIPKFTNRPLTMSRTSETIDIGAPTRGKSDMSSLDALAMAASASTGKKAGKAKPLNSATTDSRVESARLSPAEILASATVSPSLVMARSIANQNQQQERLLNLRREDDELKRQIQEEEHKLQHYKSRREALSIPKVPKVSPFSSLRIPEVPKGFVPADQKPDKLSTAISSLKSSIDRKIMMNNVSIPSMNLSSAMQARSISNRLALDSFPLGNFPSQLQQLPQHLQALQQQAALYRQKSNLLSMQLKSSQNPLIQHLRSGSLTSAAHLRLQQLRNSQMIDLASSCSDHSEITLKRRNGYSSETSSPLTLGGISTSKKTGSSRSKRTK